MVGRSYPAGHTDAFGGGTPGDRDKYAYGYDCLSSRTYRQNALSAGKDWLYGYDKLARLVSSGSGTLNENKNGLASTAFREQWGLSPVGNWGTYKRDSDGSDPWAFEQARSHNDVNEIDTDNDHTTGGEAITGSGSANWVDPRYDAAGNMSLTPRPGDESTASEALLLVYDPWNRPVRVYRDSDGDAVLDIPGDALIAAYAYDGLNRRVKKVVEGDPDVTYDYYYNTSWQVLEVRKSGNTHPFEQYAWSGRYIDAPVVRWQDADDDGDLTDTDETLYYLTDANMNVTCLADTAGSPRERYAYEPYGKVAFHAGDWSGRSASAYANDILYGGYRHDTETGLYHVRNRYYHPALGRWVQRDFLEYGDTMNLYEYAAGQVAVATDPMGLEARSGVFPPRECLKEPPPGQPFPVPPGGSPPGTELIPGCGAWAKLFYDGNNPRCLDRLPCLTNVLRLEKMLANLYGRAAHAMVCYGGNIDDGHRQQIQQILSEVGDCGPVIRKTCSGSRPPPPPPVPRAPPAPDPARVPIPVIIPQPWAPPQLVRVPQPVRVPWRPPPFPYPERWLPGLFRVVINLPIVVIPDFFLPITSKPVRFTSNGRVPEMI